MNLEMDPVLPSMGTRRSVVLVGDVMDWLKQLPDGKFRTCVTSPPYWGLRDYGTGSWEGGDPDCTHKLHAPESLAKTQASTIQPTANANHAQQPWLGGRCGRCGARREDEQLGMEATFDQYLQKLTAIFSELRRTMADDGTLWVNMGDSYAGSWGNYAPGGIKSQQRLKNTERLPRKAWNDTARKPPSANASRSGLKEKDLVGQPWALAFALRNDGWYLRSEIIWNKPNPMPESVQDRPTRSHEQLFLFAKSKRYYYDADAIREPLADTSLVRISQPNFENQTGGEKDYGKDGHSNRSQRKALEGLKNKISANWNTRPGNHRVNAQSPELFRRSEAANEFPTREKRDGNRRRLDKEGANSRMHFDRDPAHKKIQKERKELRPFGDRGGQDNGQGGRMYDPNGVTVRNKRTVWEIATQASEEAHFATFPEKLVEPCILAGSEPGDTVLDPFAGSGTTGKVALKHGRMFVGIELNQQYAEMAERRMGGIHLPLIGVER